MGYGDSSHCLHGRRCRYLGSVKRISFILTFALALALPAIAAPSYDWPEHLSKKQLAALIAAARTPAEHRRIAAYFRDRSDLLRAESDSQLKLTTEFMANPVTNNDKSVRETVIHCDEQARSLRAKSAKARALAKEHERMAREAAEQ